LPALRNSKLVHTFEQTGSKRVVVDSQYFGRYGSKRELIARRVLGRGGCVSTAELWEEFGARTSRLPGFFDTHIRLMVDDGVMRGDLESVEMAPDWREALERVRARTDEDGDNRRQSEKYADRRRKRRERLEGERRGTVARPERVPDLVGPERNAEVFAAAKERDHAARVEEQRRKVGTTAAVFIADALEGVSGFGWRELGDLWRERGGGREDLRAVVVDPASPWTFGREEDSGLMYVKRWAAGSDVRTQKLRGGESLNPTPKKVPAEVVPMRSNPATVAGLEKTTTDAGDPRDVFRNTPMQGRGIPTEANLEAAPRKLPPKVGGVFVHGPECSCWLCDDEEPAGRVEVGASA
jgi:hypothetical protein